MQEQLHSELVTVWEAVSQAPIVGLGTGKLSIRLGNRNVLVGVDDGGSRHLLIPVSDAVDMPRIWRSTSIRVNRRNMRGSDKVVFTWLDVHCRKAELAGVFALLSAMVIESLENIALEDIEPACIRALDAWRDLFGNERRSEESVIGLLGEMLVVEKLAASSQTSVFGTWTGPQGGRHDFRNGNLAIEVKTTTRRNGRPAQIHGVLQLLEPSGGELCMAFLRIEPTPGGRESIASVAERLFALGISKSDLMDVLEDFDVADLAEESANATYSMVEDLWFDVSGKRDSSGGNSAESGESCPGFPRIIPASFFSGELQPGITDLRYVVDLAHCKAMDPGDVISYLSDFLGEA
jgi:hypothetical protein